MPEVTPAGNHVGGKLGCADVHVGRMIDVCEQFTLDELVSLDEEDMNRLLQHYKERRVPPYGVGVGK